MVFWTSAPPTPWQAVKDRNMAAALTTPSTEWPQAKHTLVNFGNCVFVAFIALRSDDALLFSTAMHQFDGCLTGHAVWPSTAEAPVELAAAVMGAAEHSRCLLDHLQHIKTASSAVLVILAAFRAVHGSSIVWAYTERGAALALQMLFRRIDSDIITPQYVLCLLQVMTTARVSDRVACLVLIDVVAVRSQADQAQFLAHALRNYPYVLQEVLSVLSVGDRAELSLFIALSRLMGPASKVLFRSSAEAVIPAAAQSFNRTVFDRLDQLFREQFDPEAFEGIVRAIMRMNFPRTTWLAIADTAWASHFDVAADALVRAVSIYPRLSFPELLVATEAAPRTISLSPAQVDNIVQLLPRTVHFLPNSRLVVDGTLTLYGHIVARHLESDCSPSSVEQLWGHAARAGPGREIVALFCTYWSAAAAVRSAPHYVSKAVLSSISNCRGRLTRQEDAAVHGVVGPYPALVAAVRNYSDSVAGSLGTLSAARITKLIGADDDPSDGVWTLVARLVPGAADLQLADRLAAHRGAIDLAITALWRQLCRASALQSLLPSQRVMLDHGTLGERLASVAQFARERSLTESLLFIKTETEALQECLDRMIGAGECVLSIPDECCDRTLPAATCSRVAAALFAMVLDERHDPGPLNVEAVSHLMRQMARRATSLFGAEADQQDILEVQNVLRDALTGVDLGREQALIGRLVPGGVDMRNLFQQMAAAGTARALQSIVRELWPAAEDLSAELQQLGGSVAAVRIGHPLTAATLVAAPLVEVWRALAAAAPLRALITRPLSGDSSIDGKVLNDRILGTVIVEMRNHEGRVSVRNALDLLRRVLPVLQGLAPKTVRSDTVTFLRDSAASVGDRSPALLAQHVAEINALCDNLVTAIATLGKPRGTEHTRVCLTRLNDPAAAIQLQLKVSGSGIELSLCKADLTLWEDFAGAQLHEFAANTRLLASGENDESRAFLSCLAHAEATGQQLLCARDSGFPGATGQVRRWPAAVAIDEDTSQAELAAAEVQLAEWEQALAAAEGRHQHLALLPVPLLAELLTAPRTSHLPAIGCALGFTATAACHEAVQTDFATNAAAGVAATKEAAHPLALDCLARAVSSAFTVGMDRVLSPPPAAPGLAAASWQRSCAVSDEAEVNTALFGWYAARPPLPVERLHCTAELRPQTVADYLRRVALLPGLRFAVVRPERLSPEAAARFTIVLLALCQSPAPKAPLLIVHGASFHTTAESYTPPAVRPALRIAKLDVVCGPFGSGKTAALRPKLADPGRFAVLEPRLPTDEFADTQCELAIPEDLLAAVAGRGADKYDTGFDVAFHAVTDTEGDVSVARASAVDLALAQLACWGYLTTAQGDVVPAAPNLRVVVEVHADTAAAGRCLLPLLFAAAADHVSETALDVSTLELWDRGVDFTSIRVVGELLDHDFCEALGPCFVAACVTLFNDVRWIDQTNPILTLNGLLRDVDGDHDAGAVRAVLATTFGPQTISVPGRLPRVIKLLASLLLPPVLSPWLGSELTQRERRAQLAELMAMAVHVSAPDALLMTPGAEPVCVVTASAQILRLDHSWADLDASPAFRRFREQLPAGSGDQLLWAAVMYRALAPADNHLLQGALAVAEIAAARRFVLSHAVVGRIVVILHLCTSRCDFVLSSSTGSGKTATLAFTSECMAYAKRRTLRAELLLHKGKFRPTKPDEFCRAAEAVREALPSIHLPDEGDIDFELDDDATPEAVVERWQGYGESTTEATVCFAGEIERCRAARAEREKHDRVVPFFMRITVRPDYSARDALRDVEEFLRLAESPVGRPMQFLLFWDEINTSDDLAEMEACLRDRILCRRALPPNVVVIGAINPLRDTAAPQGQDEQHYIVREISPGLAARVVKFPHLGSTERAELLRGLTVGEAYPEFSTLLTEPHAAAMRCNRAPIRSQRSLIRAVTFQKAVLYLLRVADHTDGTYHDDRQHCIRATIASAMINFALQFRGNDRRRVEEALTNAYVELQLQRVLRRESPMDVFRDVLDSVVNQAHIDAPGLTFSGTMQEMLLLLLVTVVADRPMTGMLQGIPGCGKTTAVRIIEASMQGSGSTTAFFRNINVVLRVHWQLCHTYTTAAQLRGSFDRHRETDTTPLIAPGLQDSVERAAVERTLLMIDESTHALRAAKTNKALHEPIDGEWVRSALAGNEELDDANRDRTILLRISECDAHQIFELALGALAPTDANRAGVTALVAWLLSDEVCDRHFRGSLPDQRDVLFAMHRLRYTDMTAEGNNVTPATVFACVEENFGRAADFEGLCRGAVACLGHAAEEFQLEVRPRLQCFGEAMSRQRPHRQPPHLWPRNKLVVLPDSSESQLAEVIKVATDASTAACPDRETRVVRVSEFSNDKSAIGLANVVHAVRHSAERGHHVVLVNGLAVFQSFFDLLVRSFAGVVEGRATVKIALSTFTVEVVAHPDFAMTVVLPQEALDDPQSEVRAFMSRMEVYRLPPTEAAVAEEVLESVRRFVATVGRQSFIGGMPDATLRSTAAAAVASKLAVDPAASVQDQIAAAVRQLLAFVPPNAATLMLSSRRVGLDPDLYLGAYFAEQPHFAGLEAALDRCTNGRHVLAFTHDGFGAAAVSTRPLRRCATLAAAEYSSSATFAAALEKVKGAEMIAVVVPGGPSNTALINEIKAALQRLDSDAKRAVVVVCDGVGSGREYPTVHTAAWDLLYLDTIAAPAQQIQHAIARHLGNAAAAAPGDGPASINSLLRHVVDRYRPPLELPEFLSGDVRRFYEEGTPSDERMRILENALRPAMIAALQRGAAHAQETSAVLRCAQEVAQSDHPLPFTPALEAKMQNLSAASAERVLRVATDEFALVSLANYNQAAEAPRNAILSLACAHAALMTHATPSSAPRCPLNPWLLWAMRAAAAAHLPRPAESLSDYTARLMRSEALQALDAAVDEKELFADAAHDAVVNLLSARRMQAAPELVSRHCARLRDSLGEFDAGAGWLHTTMHVVFAAAHYSTVADGTADSLRLATLRIGAGSGTNAAHRLAAWARTALATASKQQMPGVLGKVAAAHPWAGLPDDGSGAVVQFASVVRCLVGDDTSLGSLAAPAPAVNPAWAECFGVVKDTAVARPEDKERLLRALITHAVLQPGFVAEPLLVATLELPQPSSVQLAKLVLYATVVSGDHSLSDSIGALCSAADGALRRCEMPRMAGPVWATANGDAPGELTLDSGRIPAPAAALLLVLVEKLRHAGNEFCSAAQSLQMALLVRWSPATKQICETALFHAWAWRIASSKNNDDVPAVDAFWNETRRADSPWRPLVAAAIFRMAPSARADAARALLDLPLHARPWPTEATIPALFDEHDPEHAVASSFQRLLSEGTVSELVAAVAAAANRKGPLLVAAVVDTTLRGDLAEAFQDRAAMAEVAKAVVPEGHPDHGLWTDLLSVAAGAGTDVLIAASHADAVLPEIDLLRNDGAVWRQLLTFTALCLSADAATNHYAAYFREPSRAKRRRAHAFGDMFSVPIIHGLDCGATVLDVTAGKPRFQFGVRPPWLPDGRVVSLALYYVYLALVGHVLLFPALAERCNETAVTDIGQRSLLSKDDYNAKTVAGRVTTFVAAKVLELRGLHDVFSWRDDFDAVFHRLAPAAVASTPAERDVYDDNATRAAAESRFMQEFVQALQGAVAHRRALAQAIGSVSEWTTNAARDAQRLLAEAPASPLAMNAPGATVIATALRPEVQRAVALLPHIPPLARLHVLLQRDYGHGAVGTLADVPEQVAAAALKAQNSIVRICGGQAQFECNPNQVLQDWGALDAVFIASCLQTDGAECLAFTAAINCLADAAKLFTDAGVTLPELPEAKAVLAAAAALVVVPQGAGLMAPGVAHMAAVLPLLAGLADATEVTAAVLQVAIAVPLLVVRDGLPHISALQCSCDRRDTGADAPLSDEQKLDRLRTAADSAAGALPPALPQAFFAAAQPLRGDAANAATILRDAAAMALQNGANGAHGVPLAELLPATVEGNEARARHLLSFLPECWKVPHAKAVFDVLVSISEASGDVALERGLELFPPQFHANLPPGIDVARALAETAQKPRTTEAITDMCDHLGLAADYLAAGVAGAGDVPLAEFIHFCQDDLWRPLSRLLGVAEDCGLRTTHALQLWAAFTATISALQIRRFQDVGARWVEVEEEDRLSETNTASSETDSASSVSSLPAEPSPDVTSRTALDIGGAVLCLATIRRARNARKPTVQSNKATVPHTLTACPADVCRISEKNVAATLLDADEADGRSLDEQSRILLELTAGKRLPPKRKPNHAAFIVPREVPPTPFVCPKAELDALQARSSCSRKICENIGVSNVLRALVLPFMVARDLRRVPCATIAMVSEGDDGPPIVSRPLRYWAQGRWREEQREAFALSPVSLVVQPGAGTDGVPCDLATGALLQGDCTWRDVSDVGVQVHDSAVKLLVRNADGEQLGAELVVGSSTPIVGAAKALACPAVFPDDAAAVSTLVRGGAPTDHVLCPEPNAVEIDLLGSRYTAATVGELLRGLPHLPATTEVWASEQRLDPDAGLRADITYELRRRFKVTAHLPASTDTRTVSIPFDPAHPPPMPTVVQRLCEVLGAASEGFVLFDRVTYRLLEVVEPATRSLFLAPREEVRRVVLRSFDDHAHSIGEFHSDASCEHVHECLRAGLPDAPADMVLCARFALRNAPYVAVECGRGWPMGRGPLLGSLPGQSFGHADEGSLTDGSGTADDAPSTCRSGSSAADVEFWGGEAGSHEDDESLRSESVGVASDAEDDLEWPDADEADGHPLSSIPADLTDVDIDAHISLRLFHPAHLFTVTVSIEEQTPEIVRMWNRGSNSVASDIRSWVLSVRGATPQVISTASLHSAVLSEDYGLTTPSAAPVRVTFAVASGTSVCATEVLAAPGDSFTSIAVAAANQLNLPTALIRSGVWKIHETEREVCVVRHPASFR